MRFRKASSSSTTAISLPALPSHESSFSGKKEKVRSKTPLGDLSLDHDNVTARRPARSRTSSSQHHHKAPSSAIKSPCLKRAKLQEECNLEMSYPTNLVDIPTKAQIQSLYENAIASSSTTSHQVQLDEAGTGLLSLEQVLLPAVAQQEAQALKQLQAKAQRGVNDGSVKDAKVWVHALEACRGAVYQSVAAGIHGAHTARLEREAKEQELTERQQEQRRVALEEKQKQRELERERRREERAQAKALERQRRKLQQKKTHRPNVQLWREVALLMTELTRLEKEERLWKEAQQALAVRQRELEQKKAVQAQQQVQEQNKEEDDMEVVPEAQRVEEAVQSIVLSSKRIQQALGMVSNLVTESEAIRKEIYSKYKEDHQFHGYRGVKDPKGLLRVLSSMEED